MEKSKPIVVASLAVVVCASIVGAYMVLGPGVNGPDITSSQAIDIVMSNPNASEYFSSLYKVEDWRVTTTTLVDSSPNGNVSEVGVWKVEILERTCACAGVKPLNVIEGYVSASTGELLEISVGYASESEYDKNTCSSTACH